MVGKWVSLFITAVLCLFACLTSQSEAQQLQTGSLTITVTDSLTSAPINNAEVFLLSEGTPQSSLTEANGKLTFPELQPGVYRVEVHHAGYDKGEAQEFELGPGARLRITVKLAPSIKEIGSVTAHSSIAVNVESVNDASPERKISQSLKDAMSKMAGISLDDTGYENSAFNISLRNHDASQTGYTVDGMPVSGPGSRSLGAAQDLFTGASVNFNPTASYMGGTINFVTLRPTKTWAFNVTGTLGNFGTGAYVLNTTGSIGRIGMALSHSMNARDSFLSGLTYADQSGRLFEHAGASQNSADLFKLSAPLSKRATMNLAALVTNSTSSSICNDFVTIAPCGFGSVPVRRGHSSFVTAAVTSLVGNVDLNIYANVSQGRFSSEDLHRTLDSASLAPYGSVYGYRSLNFGANGSVTARRHTFSFGIYEMSSRQDSTQTVNGTLVTVKQPSTQSGSVYAYDKIKSNDRLAVTHGISMDSATGAGRALVLSETVDWTPAKNDAYQGRVSVGSAEPQFYAANVISDPVDAQFDCYNHTTFVSGPQDAPVPQSSVSYNLSWQHNFRTGTFSASAYRQNAYGQPFYAAVPAAAEPGALFPNGLAQYIADLQLIWSRPSVCGSTPFDPSKLFVSQSISGTGQVYEGYSLSGRVSLGKSVAIFPSYSVGSTFLSNVDPRLAFPGSYYAAGSQLPHRPLRTANLIVDGVLARAPPRVDSGRAVYRRK